MILIRNVYLFGYAGFSFFVFLFFAEKNPSRVLINHERIHFFQQVELLFIFHWILYVLFYLYHLARISGRAGIKLKQRHDIAYRAIPFEKEAYHNEKNLTYLADRPWFAWIRHL